MTQRLSKIGVAGAALLGGILAILLFTTSCSIHTSDNERGNKNKDVDIKTPFGDLSVHKQIDPKQIGLPLYPGAQLRTDKDESSANVEMSIPGFEMKVIAAKYVTDDDQDKVLDFYRKELKSMDSKMTECRGEIDMDKERSGGEVRCKERPGSDTVSLVIGSPQRHRIAAIKQRFGHTEIDLVYLRFRGGEDDEHRL